MKDKIKQEMLDWLETNECEDEEAIKGFVDLVMEKTTESLLEEIKKQFKEEFLSGNLKHDFVISPDYYLELKLKEAKQNFSKGDEQEEETTETTEF